MDGQLGMHLVFSPHFCSPEGHSFSSQLGQKIFLSLIIFVTLIVINILESIHFSFYTGYFE